MTQGSTMVHLDAATLTGLAAGERARLLHVATCPLCRRKLSAQAENVESVRPHDGDGEASAALLRLLRRLTGAGLERRIEAVEHEREQAQERVRELLAHPDRWGAAGAELRYVTPEVVSRLIEAAKGEEPRLALRLLALASDLAVQLVGRRRGVSLDQELLIEVRCTRAQRLLDLGHRGEAARELRRAAALLSPELGYGRPRPKHATEDHFCWAL